MIAMEEQKQKMWDKGIVERGLKGGVAGLLGGTVFGIWMSNQGVLSLIASMMGGSSPLLCLVIHLMISMGIVMLIFTLHLGGTEIKPENYPAFIESLRTAFVVFTILCFGGIFASLARGKVH